MKASSSTVRTREPVVHKGWSVGGPLMDTVKIKSDHLKQVVDLTDRVNALITKRKVTEGLCCLFLTHTTACLTTGEVGEGTEKDLLDVVQELIPKIDFRHGH